MTLQGCISIQIDLTKKKYSDRIKYLVLMIGGNSSVKETS